MRNNKVIGLLFIMSLLLAWEAGAKEISTPCLRFEVPDSLQTKDIQGLSFFAYNEEYMIGVAEYEGDFDVTKVKASMDTVFFNLSKAKRIDMESEYFFQWTKDYSKKYYVRENGKNVITYSSYGTDVAYCFYFAYENEAVKKKIDEIIGSIQDRSELRDSCIENAFNAFNYAVGYWLLYYFLVVIAGVAMSFVTPTWLWKIIAALGVTLLAAILLSLTCWGRWDILSGALMFTFILNLVFNVAAPVVIFIFTHFEFS